MLQIRMKTPEAKILATTLLITQVILQYFQSRGQAPDSRISISPTYFHLTAKWKGQTTQEMP